jgi:putative glycosyltransferase (TIGR04348 family)
MIFTPMKIALITPALPTSRAGNRVTAIRWNNILLELGHKVRVLTNFNDAGHKKKKFDAMIALHAWRSAPSINDFKLQYPQKPLIVALTGTDLYKFIHSHPKPTLRSIKQADTLITLHDLAYLAIPKTFQQKVRVIYQSADLIKRKANKSKRYFDICVIGHLRAEKDPLRTAYAVRKLPNHSLIRVKQYGKAHTPAWAVRAEKEMQINPRYKWYGEVPHWKINQLYANVDLMVLSSKMEGGANVISEACVAGIPIIASRIDGSVGLLGENYPAFYPCADTKSLRHLLLKAEADKSFLTRLEKAARGKAGLFTYAREKRNIKKLLYDFL